MSAWPSQPGPTLPEVLREHARRIPDRIAFRFLGDGENVTDLLTYAQLEAAARTRGAELARLGRPGDRAVLAHAPGLDFVVDLLGCWHAGLAPVPVYPPLGRREIDTARQIARATRPVAVLTDLPGTVGEILAEAPGAVELGPVNRGTDGGTDGGAGGDAPAPDPERVALLQFTSGSTGTPRGVVVKHRQLTANQHRIREAYRTDEDSVVVSWLPMYHDMGLIGAVLHPLFLGAGAVIMSPLAFLERPARWLRALSRYQGTISPAPNFAYDLAVRKVTGAELADLDLSRWRVAINGGEPVRPRTVEAFTRHFAPAGLRPQVMTPSYGLAEGTLLVSAQDADRAPSSAVPPTGDERAAEPVISCGRPPQSVRIAGPDGARVPDGALGEIWIDAADPSVGAGYWEQPETSAELFGARAADGSGPYLRTGDLGFIADGALHVAGRSKDVILVRGRNHFPQDIEATVEQADAGIRPGCVAAFAIDERLIVVAEVPGSGEDVSFAAVRAAVARQHGLRLEELVLVRRGTVPKTSSGKIRRRRCEEEYLAGTLARAGGEAGEPAAAAPVDSARGLVETLLAEVLPEAGTSLPRGDDVELAELGLDSLRSVQLQHALRERFGVQITLERLLGGATVGSLAAAVQEGTPNPAGVPPQQQPAPDREPVASAGQQALWFLERSSAGASRYTVVRAARLVGGVDVRALAAALRDVAARHDSLTALLDVDENGRVVTRPGSAALPDLAVLDIAAGDLGAHVAACAAEPLDPQRGPLVRATLLRPDQGADPVFVLAVHHVAADLWSLGLVLDQLGDRYAQYVHQSSNPQGGELEPLPVAPGMAEIAAAERSLLSGARGERLREAWIDFLADMPEGELRLPLDRPRPAVRTWSGALRRMPFGARLSKQVRAVARELRTTPFVVLLACYGVLLARLSGERRFVVGVPTAVRPDARSAQVVGYAVNTLPVLLDLPADGSFADLVRQTGERLRTALALREYPLPLIAAAVRPARGTDRAPLFSTMFGWTSPPPGAPEGMVALADEAAAQRLRVGGLLLEPVPVPAPAALAELDLSVSDLADDDLALVLRHATEVLDDATASGLGERLLRVVAAAVAEPRTAVADLGVLSAAERTRLAELAIGDGPLPEPGHTMIDYFRDAAAAHPQAPAIISAAGTVDYASLARDVDTTAVRIAAAGAGPASCVGVCLTAGPPFVTAMLGAFAAGYGIVPLLPSFPDERLRFTADDAAIGAVLTDRAHAERAALVAQGRPVVVLDDDAANAPSPAQAPIRRPGPDSVAYIVHTSGTTGRPKGVPITHANVLPLLLWQRERFGLGPGVRLPQTLSLSFDFGLQELFTTVLFGAALCIPEPDERLSADAYARFVRRHAVTILYLTPSFAAELAAAGAEMPSVRCVVLGGELLTYAAMQSLRPLVAPDAVFVNGYGPTEASINCSMRFLTAADVDAGTGIVPVGPPSGRSVVTVRDPWDDLTAPGGFGEVVIGGPGVAAGYLNRPAQPGRGFVPDPETGAARYRSGDLGSLRPDGDLVLFGRLDDQVKIRGFRVEPEEVRSVMLQQPQVADAVVVVAGQGPSRHLAAAVVPGPGFALDRLRARLRELLPSHQVPGRIVPVEALPRTPHGKLDRTRLDELLAAASATAGPAAGSEPVWAMERRVAEAWREALGRGAVPIGRDDSFFDLGGHSLLVAPVMTRLGRQLGLDPLPLRLLFEYPTVAALAGRLEILLAEARAQDDPSAPTSAPDAAEPAVPATAPAPAARTRRRPPQQIRISFD